MANEHDLIELPESLRAEPGIVEALNAMHAAYADPEVRKLLAARERFDQEETIRLARVEALAEVWGEAQKAMEIAGSLLAAGLDGELVARLCGLTVEQVSGGMALGKQS